MSRGFLAILAALPVTTQAAHPFVNQCGLYELTGRNACQGEHCVLAVYPGSARQTRFRYEANHPAQPYLDGATIRMRLRVTSITNDPFAAEAVREIPSRVASDLTESAARLLQGEKCVEAR